MSNEMIKRVAAAITEPSKQYVVKFYVQPKALHLNEWQIWLLDNGVETIIKFYRDHDKAENECEQLNNELLARLAIEAMKNPTKNMIYSFGYFVSTPELVETGYNQMIDSALKDE